MAWTFPALAQATALEGVRRLTAYQGEAYARRYLERLKPITEADEAAGCHGKLLKEVARQLAVRMSYEDVVRVAAAKIAPERMQRIAREELRATNEPFTVHDFLKPGFEELTQLLPPLLARPILYVAERRGWLGRVYFGMEIETTSVGGFLKFLMLAKLRRLRPFGRRFKEEQKAIDAWLALIAQAARQSTELALEVAECARLIKGYGDTHARGVANYAAIEARVIRPALAGHIPLARAADAVASARTAALTDPEGESLSQCLAEIEGTASPAAGGGVGTRHSGPARFRSSKGGGRRGPGIRRAIGRKLCRLALASARLAASLRPGMTRKKPPLSALPPVE